MALIGGILGIISFVWMLLIPVDIFAFLRVNTFFVMLAYLSLIASLLIVILALALMAKKLLARLNTILIIIAILGIIELMAFTFPYLGMLGGFLALIGGLLAWVGLRPEKAKPAKPAKKAKPKAKPKKKK
ncbi:MAG: hypothetical protein ACETWM_12260 [Candidatus Lokiarchaeia archaeon]